MAVELVIEVIAFVVRVGTKFGQGPQVGTPLHTVKF
jgi:hypothetical protein